ncbi:MAG: Trk system potassium transporter TrkA [Planctomycetes bacterium]|nr:Trk system potassium transporter TrkA [Planctomycetota bacterium]
MRILVGGEDDVAVRLVERLMQEHDVSLIAPEDARGGIVDQLEVQPFFGSCTSANLLSEAEVEKTDLFIACTVVDERNLLACAEAKQMGAKKAICFLRRLDVRSNEAEAKKLALAMGIDDVILPSERLAQEILRVVLVPDALDVEIFADGAVELIKRAIPEHAPITGGPLQKIGLPKNVILVQAKRNGKRFIPKGSTEFQAGDQITAMGTRKGLGKLSNRFLKAKRLATSARRATIVGGGVVGYEVARGMLANGWKIRIIEADGTRAEQLCDSLPVDCVLHCDGTDLQVLEDNAIADDPVLIAVTNNDERNLLVSMLAKQMGVPRIITRADKTDHGRLFESVGIDVVRSTRGAAIAAVLQHANVGVRDVQSEFEHGEVKVLQLRVPDSMPEVELRNLNAPVFAIVGAILAGDKVTIPSGKDILKGGDQVLVFCSDKDEANTRTFFEDFIAGSKGGTETQTAHD